jgi:hypothetical protein
MLKPYAKYKETPALWLNSIPDHWESHKIRELFVERSEKVSDKDYSPLSVSKAGVVPQIATVAKTNNGDNRKLVRKGDFVINSRSDRRGSSGISNYDGSVVIGAFYSYCPDRSACIAQEKAKARVDSLCGSAASRPGHHYHAQFEHHSSQPGKRYRVPGSTSPAVYCWNYGLRGQYIINVKQKVTHPAH